MQKKFCETKVKCVQKSYYFSDNDINYKPSMKNVQSFQVITFFTKIKFVPRGHPTYRAKRPMSGVMPPSLTKQFALNLYSKIRLQAALENIINNYELKNYNSLF